MVDAKIPKNPQKHSCDSCNYHTSSKKDFNKHLLTAKHKMFTHVDENDNDKSQKIPKAYVCDCGKTYKYRQSLCVHKKKCDFTPPVLENSVVDPPIAGGDMNKFASDMKELVMLLATSQNNNIKMLIENQNYLTPQQEKMMAHIFDSQSDAFYTSGHMMDDGMIDPRNMRKTLGMLLETVREGRYRKLRPNSFGVARI